MPARVFAHLMDWGKPNGTPADGTLRVRIEWSKLDGDRANGKFLCPTFELSTKSRLTNDVVIALLDHLNERYPTEDYSDRDIVLWEE